MLVALAGAPAPVDEPEPLDSETATALRIDAAVTALTDAPPQIVQAADDLVARLDAITTSRLIERNSSGLLVRAA